MVSSIIEIIIVSEHGEHIRRAYMDVPYGNEQQRVVVVLSDPSSVVVDMSLRDVLNECMAEQLAMTEGFDA